MTARLTIAGILDIAERRLFTLVLQDRKRLPGRFFARYSGASGDRLFA